jgi:hypothetical protein
MKRPKYASIWGMYSGQHGCSFQYLLNEEPPDFIEIETDLVCYPVALIEISLKYRDLIEQL